MEKLSNLNIVKERKECCNARDVLWYLVFTGFAVNYMIRINLNIAIVSMVKTRIQTNETLTSECIINTEVENTTRILLHLNGTLSGTEDSMFNTSDIIQDKSVKFPWDEKLQSTILGAFFWLHWFTQIPGGLLSSKYGAKIFFGVPNFIGVLCCFLIPTAAIMGPNYLMFIRALQGLICGFCWPSMHNMTARWIPPNERSKFVTAYLGSSVGAALTYPICGLIIDKWGWELVFYVCGVMGTLWFIAWWFLVYDSPSQHPRISDNEKEYILNCLGQSYTKEKAPVPWGHIIRSTPVWTNVLAQWGGIWGLFTLMTHTPTYFKFIHGWNIRTTGILSGLPHILRMAWAYICSQIGDYLLRSNKMSRTNVRKLATFGCTIGQGIFMLALAYSGCNRLWAVIFLTASVMMNGSVSTGPLASIVDLSPNYASVILGIVNTAAAVVGFLTPAVVGYFTFENQTAHQWQKVFWIAATMLIASGILFITLAYSELQPWNSPDELNQNNKVELVKMNKEGNEKDDKKEKNENV